jgi:hypothetical protein
VQRVLLRFTLAFCVLGLVYYSAFWEEQTDNQLSKSVVKSTLAPTSLVTVSNPATTVEAESQKVLDQNQISIRPVNVPEGALPMEVMISKFMAERQRAAKEAAELNPFGPGPGASSSRTGVQ